MPTMIANRQLIGSYGNIAPDEVFEAGEDIASNLEMRGLARRAQEPVVTYETKVITPAAPPVSTREPFRDVPVPDEKPAPVAPASDRVLSSTDVPQPRTARSGKRRGRPRLNTPK